MNMQMLGNYMVGKVNDQFYIFFVRVALGGVTFGQIDQAFHTAEDAHLYLLEMAKENSTPDNTFLVVEVAKNYMYISQDNTKDAEEKNNA